MNIQILRTHIRITIAKTCVEITEKEKSALLTYLIDAGSNDLAAEIETFTPRQLEDFIINHVL